MQTVMMILSFMLGMFLVWWLGAEHGFKTAKKRYQGSLDRLKRSHDKIFKAYDLLCDLGENSTRLIERMLQEFPAEQELSNKTGEMYVEHVMLVQELNELDKKAEKEEAEEE